MLATAGSTWDTSTAACAADSTPPVVRSVVFHVMRRGVRGAGLPSRGVSGYNCGASTAGSVGRVSCTQECTTARAAAPDTHRVARTPRTRRAAPLAAVAAAHRPATPRRRRRLPLLRVRLPHTLLAAVGGAASAQARAIPLTRREEASLAPLNGVGNLQAQVGSRGGATRPQRIRAATTTRAARIDLVARAWGGTYPGHTAQTFSPTITPPPLGTNCQAATPRHHFRESALAVPPQRPGWGWGPIEATHAPGPRRGQRWRTAA